MRINIRLVAAVSALLIMYLVCRGSASKPPTTTPTQPASGVTIIPDTPKPTNTPQPAPVGLTRDHPAPMAVPVDIGGDMTLTVMFVMRPANQMVADGNMFNDTPEPEQEYILVDVRVECKKSANDKCIFLTYELKTVGANGKIQDQASVAGVPKTLESSSEFFGGAAIEGGVVFLATTNDTTTVLMYEPLFFGDPLYIALQ